MCGCPIVVDEHLLARYRNFLGIRSRRELANSFSAQGDALGVEFFSCGFDFRTHLIDLIAGLCKLGKFFFDFFMYSCEIRLTL